MKNIALLFLVISIVACSNPEKKTPSGPNKAEIAAAFENFKQQFVLDMWKHYPVAASYEGFHDYDSLLPIPNTETKEKRKAFLASVDSVVHSFNLDSLSDQDKIDYFLIEEYVQSSHFYREKYRSGTWNPSSFNIGGTFFQVINYRDNSLSARLDHLFRKLDFVPAYYAQAQKNIKTPTEVHTNLAIQQLKGSLSVFEETLLDSLAASDKDEAFKSAFKVKVDTAVAAINRFRTFVEEVLLPGLKENQKSFRIGKELYVEKFSADIKSAYSAEEIYREALAEKTQLHGKMFDLANSLWDKYQGKTEKPADSLKLIRQVIEKISLQHAHRDSFIVSIRRQIPELEKFVSEKDLMTQDPEKPLVVRATPEYMRGFAGASISAPGPYDKNADTYYNVTPLDHYSPEAAESYLREYNTYTLQILNIHEAIPGHYTQLVYSNKSPSLIKSLLGNGAMVEGWAVYTERMMLENGYGNDLPELWLMYYKWNLRTVCNTILDYGIHVNDLTEEAAMDLLMNQAFQEQSEAEGKWKRARLSQVQLCSYFTGYFEIMRLREDLKVLMGDRFDLKTFHEDFLSFGSSPVKYIRELLFDKYGLTEKEA